MMLDNLKTLNMPEHAQGDQKNYSRSDSMLFNICIFCSLPISKEKKFNEPFKQIVFGQIRSLCPLTMMRRDRVVEDKDGQTIKITLQGRRYDYE